MTNVSKDKDKNKEEEEVILARDKMKKCEKMSDKNEKINCVYNILHDITKAQDIVNLTIYKMINDEEDPRWIPTLMADNANAILLEISQLKGHPQSMTRSGGYIEEKVNSLNNRWYSLLSKYKN